MTETPLDSLTLESTGEWEATSVPVRLRRDLPLRGLLRAYLGIETEARASAPPEPTDFDAVTLPPVWGNVEAALSLLVFVPQVYPIQSATVGNTTGTRRQHSGWRMRLEALRLRRGNPALGDPPQLSAASLTMVARLGALTDTLASIRGATVAMNVVPLSDGGVQAEWTHRGGKANHFEVAVSPETYDRYEMLSTTESLDGAIETTWREIPDATIAEVLSTFEEFLTRIAAG
jgi:hypothetical protein